MVVEGCSCRALWQRKGPPLAVLVRERAVGPFGPGVCVKVCVVVRFESPTAEGVGRVVCWGGTGSGRKSPQVPSSAKDQAAPALVHAAPRDLERSKVRAANFCSIEDPSV